MTTPTDVVSLLKRDEGTVLHAYQDSMSYWTIGTGRLIDQRKGGGITEEESDFLLINDIARCRAELTNQLPWFIDLDTVRQAVLISMAFQLGIAGLLKFVRTLAAVRYGRYDEAATGMRDSLWAKQTPERAARLASMMETGEWI